MLLNRGKEVIAITKAHKQVGAYESLEQAKQILNKNYRPEELLRRFGQSNCAQQELADLAEIPLSKRNLHTLHAEIRYAPYIEREQNEIERINKYQELIREEMRKLFSETVVNHAINPRNVGNMKAADGYASVTGPCGDTVDILLVTKCQ